MSSLFKALKQIEEQTKQQSVQLPQKSSSTALLKKRQYRPFFKVALVVFFGCCAGGAVLFLVWLKGDELLLAKDWFARQLNRPEEVSMVSSLPVPRPEPVTAVIPVVELPPPLVMVKKEEKERQTSPVVVSSVTLPGGNEKAELVPQEAKEPIQRIPDVQQSIMRYKKLLYQAEKRRVKGDMTAAVKLYKKAWKLNGNTDVANNLAAGLIQLGRVAEAVLVLDKALTLSPNNPDLLYNLKIAKDVR